MLNRKRSLLLSILFLISIGCSEKKGSTEPDIEYVTGKNRYTIEVDGVDREYFVHVPTGYSADAATPLVLMLHGASGSGEGSYNNSGWKELADEENILTVFPTALIHCYTNAFNETLTNTRWFSFPPDNHFCQGQAPKDDVKFLRQVIGEMRQRFNINSQRIYVVGFSSGAQMGFRCAVEMSDLIAAVVESGATQTTDGGFTPLRKLPVYFEVGNKDESWFGTGVTIPMASFDSMLTHNLGFRKTVNVHSNTFGFSTEYTKSGEQDSALTATFRSVPPGENREFKFSLINNLGHAYPNTYNHPVHGARVHWAWLKKYKLSEK